MVGKDTPAKKPAKAAPRRSRAKPKTAAADPKPQVEAAAAASSPDPAPGPQAGDGFTGAFSAAGAETLESLEALSRNLARAAMMAQGAIAEAALRQADRPPGIDTDPFHVGPAMAKVMSSLAGRPDAMMEAQGDLWRRYAELWHFAARRAMGETASPVVSPAKGDKRFNAPDWTENPVFDVIKQSYLITSDWMNGLVTRAENIDPLSRRRVEFFTRMLTDALSPSNFLASNPEALK
ncbi:MAG: class I poly(R)-hydroxyalkanoic acid synthase, partial [Phenylobacterium sp.]